MKLTKRNRILPITAAVIIALAFSSCKKFLEISPPENLRVSALVFEKDSTAQKAMAAIYSKLADGDNFSGGSYNSLTYRLSLYADEMRFYPSGYGGSFNRSLYENNLTAYDGAIGLTWGSFYNILFNANRLMEGLDQSAGVSETLKKQLKGEALFTRAFCHFYLVNLFGPVPYVNSSDYRQNQKISRTPVAGVYSGIIADLNEAKELLADTYPSAGRVRINKGAVLALLSRAYLYNSEWANAESTATELIGKTSLYSLPEDLDAALLNNSSEVIWALIPDGAEASRGTYEAQAFILLIPPIGRSSITDGLWNSFEAGDKRQAQWTGTLNEGLSNWYYPYKYKRGGSAKGDNNEYSVVLRLAEQYLIRAEARAKQEKLSEAAADINVIRKRAGLGNTAAGTQAQLLTAVEQERRVELFTEWGHRFFDLKRWGKLDAVLGPEKIGWNSTDALWPLPFGEIVANQNLTQNSGY